MTKCDECSHQYSEFCIGCAYADANGHPIISIPDNDETGEEI